MRKFVMQAVLLGLATAVAAPAFGAQAGGADAEKKKDEIATMHIDEGVIMVSEGGQTAFVSGVQEQRLIDKTRLMVAKDSKVTVEFDKGCDVTYDKPGVYEIEDKCPVVAAWWGTTPAGTLLLNGAVTAGVATLAVNLHKHPPCSR